MWEARDTERHYTTSKLLCWVALDRAIGLADTIGRADDVPRWTKARDELRAAILERAWSGKTGAYAGAFGSDELDAGVLLMPIVGFLPATDERMRRTIDAVERVLGRGNGLVARWAAESAGFVLSSYWLADCLARAGEIDRARAVFDQVTGAANDLGLLAEMLDPATGAQLGNFPQALSHVGLVNAALSIEAAAGG
jgi:GH15 family glucan-1,4-alpha-glucosidase